MNWANISPDEECPCCFNIYTISENISHFPCLHASCVKCYIKCNKCPICRSPFNNNLKPAIYAIIKDITYDITTGIQNNEDKTPQIIKLEELKKYI